MFFKKKKKISVYNYLTEEDKRKYEDLNKGIPIGDMVETLEFLERLEETKRKLK